LKIATWNINGIVKRLDNLLSWLEEAEPDVVCLSTVEWDKSEPVIRRVAA
jgi:exodeoxyribonuclease-3